MGLESILNCRQYWVMTGNAKVSWVTLGNEQHLILCKINVWINSVEFIELVQHSKTWQH